MKGTSEQERRATPTKIRYVPNRLLKYERELKGWSQVYVAEKLGAQTNLVTRWEKGYAFPSPYYRQRLCQLFEKDAEALGLIKRVDADADPEPPATEDARDEVEIREESAPAKEASPLPLEESGTAERQNNLLLHKSGKRYAHVRRTLLIGMAGGVVAGIIEALYWKKSADSVNPTVVTPVPQPDAITTQYIYRTATAKDVNYVSWSPHGHAIACVTGDSQVQVLRASDGKTERTYAEHHNWVNCASWSPDESLIASASADKTVQIWDVKTGQCKLIYRGHSTTVLSVCWSPNGTFLASSGKDGYVHIWHAATGKEQSRYQAHKGYVWTVSWSFDSTKVASCGEDGTIQVWDLSAGAKDVQFVYAGPTGSTVNQVIWSPDGKRLVSAHDNATVYIWDTLTGRKMLAYTGHKDAVITARWSPDGAYIASGGLDRTVQIWSAISGKQLLTYTKHTDEVYEVSWSPDGSSLASASKDHTMHVCRVSLGKR